MNSAAQIAAFFDLDGTLLAPPSLEWRFIGYLLARDEIRFRHLARWLAHCAAAILRDPRAATEGNKLYLSGLRECLVAEWSNSHAALELPFFPQGIARIAWHHAQQHQIFLVTGTLAPLARAIVRQLPCPVEVCATELELRNHSWAGLLAGRHMSAEVKARTIRTIAERRNIALAHSFAYGDQMADLAMLDAVGYPVAVNPSAELASRARKHRWTTCRWDQPQALMPAERRTLLTPEQVP
jgi:HAD superfamily phosphoserine phosphatase-like hydrolase